MYSNQINTAEGQFRPSGTYYFNSYAYQYWYRALWQRMLSVFKFTLPEEWSSVQGCSDYFESCLFSRGWVAVWNDPQMGLVFNPATFGGYNFYYQPTKAIVSNPALPTTRELVIGKDCGLIKLSPDCRGFSDVVDFYARKLSCLDSALDQSFINQRLCTIVNVNSKAAAETIKKAFDNKTSGEPLVVLNDAVGAQPNNVLASNNYISDKQLTDVQTLLNMFDAEIGIPTVGRDKSQYISDVQVDTKVSDGQARVQLWEETLNKSIEETKQVIPGFDITVEYRYQEGESNGETNDNGYGETAQSEE